MMSSLPSWFFAHEPALREGLPVDARPDGYERRFERDRAPALEVHIASWRRSVDATAFFAGLKTRWRGLGGKIGSGGAGFRSADGAGWSIRVYVEDNDVVRAMCAFTRSDADCARDAREEIVRYCPVYEPLVQLADERAGGVFSFYRTVAVGAESDGVCAGLRFGGGVEDDDVAAVLRASGFAFDDRWRSPSSDDVLVVWRSGDRLQVTMNPPS